MTIDNYVYQFERIPKVNVGKESTVRPDADGAKRYLLSIDKFDTRKGDRLLVHTGTGTFTLILHQELSPTEQLLTSHEMTQGYGRSYSARRIGI